MERGRLFNSQTLDITDSRNTKNWIKIKKKKIHVPSCVVTRTITVLFTVTVREDNVTTLR